MVSSLASHLNAWARPSPTSSSSSPAAAHLPLCLVETAGGVLSPSPSGSLQADMLRPLRLPGLLVASGDLGGISAALSAHECLLARGMDVGAVAVLAGREGEQGNGEAIARHLAGGPECQSSPWGLLAPPRVFLLPPPPPPPSSSESGSGSGLAAARWLDEAGPLLGGLYSALCDAHRRRLSHLERSEAFARGTFWWPFTQHGALGKVAVVDSRCGPELVTFRRGSGPPAPAPASSLESLYDGTCSWWTQGLPSSSTRRAAQESAYASARYGHVLFPEVAHAPALALASALLSPSSTTATAPGPGAGWASRVFFSDNGSTAVEVGVKMALRKYLAGKGVDRPERVEGGSGKLRVVALRGSYHGDTLGAMDVQAPSAYAGFLQARVEGAGSWKPGAGAGAGREAAKGSAKAG